MKKAILLGILMLCFMGFTGCNKPGEGKLPGTARVFQVGDKLEPQDYQPGNTGYTPIMKTENGFYFYSTEKGGLCYADAATGKVMYLCNKPECRHDGNEFCAATTDRYWIGNSCLYNGILFSTAVEETDTQFLYQLHAIALDGSERSVVCTYYTVDKGAREPERGIGWNEWQLKIHRNKVILPIELIGKEEMEDTSYYGLGILDLDTMEMVFLDEEGVSKENLKCNNISFNGDYMYFCRQEGKKNILYRYHLTEGTKESYKLMVNFSGLYLALDDDTVIYTKRQGGMLCVHHYATGENEEKLRLTNTREAVLEDGRVIENVEDYVVADLDTDGIYIYIPENESGTTYELNKETGKFEEIRESNLVVLDRELNIVAKVNLADSIDPMEWEGVDGGLHSQIRFFSYVGDEVYARFTSEENMTDVYTFRCKLADLLNGKPKFELVYSDLYSRRENGK